MVKLNKKFLDNEAERYPASSLFGPTWSLGFLLLFYLAVQVGTGVILATHYIPDAEKAFESVHKVLYKCVPGGWAIWYWHINGASFLFLFLYAHGLRAVYYGSYLRKAVWATGVLLFILMMGAAFTGYVLPWGTMSYWALTVITSFLTVIPKIGVALCRWVWGGGSVSGPTLNRFMIVHYLLPVLILAGSLVHVFYLHMDGSTLPNPTDQYVYNWEQDYIIKDVLFLLVSFGAMNFVFWYNPDMFSHPDNWVKADMRKTPPHIVPEWYFLPYYAIIKAIENKNLGVLFTVLYIASFVFLPFCDPYFNDRTRRLGSREPFTKVFLIVVLIMFISLFPLGHYPATFWVIFGTQVVLSIHFTFTIGMLVRSGVIYRRLFWKERYRMEEMEKKQQELIVARKVATSRPFRSSRRVYRRKFKKNTKRFYKIR